MSDKKSNLIVSTTEKIKNEKFVNSAQDKKYGSASRNMENFSTGFSLFTLIIFILIGVSVIRILSGYGTFSFASLLDTLANAPNIHMSLSSTITNLKILADWGVFNWLRDFLNSISSIWAVGSWCTTGLLQCIVYLGYFLGALFIA